MTNEDSKIEIEYNESESLQNEIMQDYEEDIDLIIEKCRKGDEDAFRIVVKKYQDRIYRSAYFLTGNNDDAKDITQETFIAVYHSIKRFQSKSSFYTWLYRIMLNIYNKNKRKGKKHNSVILSTNHLLKQDIDESSKIENKEKEEILHNLILKLPDKLSTVILLRHFEDMSYQEMSEVLNCSEGTIKSRLFNARKLLKEWLSKDNNNQPI